MEVIDDFLPFPEFKSLQNVIMGQDFPWRKRDHTTGSDHMYFTYCFYNHMNRQSELYQPYIIPIFQLHIVLTLEIIKI